MQGVAEAIKYQMVFDNFKTIDKTLSKRNNFSKQLISYDGILEKEEKEFAEEMKSEIKNEVESRRKNSEDLVNENKEIVQQIQNLNEKMTKNQNESIALLQEAAQKEANISQTHKNFIATITKVRANLAGDKTKISDMVKEIKTV